MLYRSLIGGALLLTLINSAEAKKLSDKHVEYIIVKAAHQAEVPSHLVLAICWLESSYITKLPEPLDGATPSYGICQVKLETAQYMDVLYKHKNPATIERLRDPYTNAFYAAKYIKYQLRRYNNDWKKAVAAYNQGSVDARRTNQKYLQRFLVAMEQRNLSTYSKLDAQK